MKIISETHVGFRGQGPACPPSGTMDKTEGHVAANRQGQSEKVHGAFRRQLSLQEASADACDGSEVRHWDRAGPEGQKTQIGDWAGGEA